MKKQHDQIPNEALTAKQAADLCGVSERHWWSLWKRSLTPTPIRLGKPIRWVRSELLDWLNYGCPSLKIWEAEKNRRKETNETSPKT